MNKLVSFDGQFWMTIQKIIISIGSGSADII